MSSRLNFPSIGIDDLSKTHLLGFQNQYHERIVHSIKTYELENLLIFFSLQQRNLKLEEGKHKGKQGK